MMVVRRRNISVFILERQYVLSVSSDNVSSDKEKSCIYYSSVIYYYCCKKTRTDLPETVPDLRRTVSTADICAEE